jgi:hypothetical protein
MKLLFKLLNTAAIAILVVVTFSAVSTYAQCKLIKIDGQVIVNPKLPTWLKAGQTLEAIGCIQSISVIEFTVSGTSMDFVQVVNITPGSSNTVVPTGKVWKVESIHPSMKVDQVLSWTYTAPGTSTFVPFVSGLYRIRMWGGGGGGGGG